MPPANDAIKPLMAGGRSKQVAQTDLCRAMADGAVRIRSQLERHTTNGFTAAGTVLQGTNFQIPPKITPEDLDWEGSRPLKPWLVRVHKLTVEIMRHSKAGKMPSWAWGDKIKTPHTIKAVCIAGEGKIHGPRNRSND